VVVRVVDFKIKEVVVLSKIGGGTKIHTEIKV